MKLHLSTPERPIASEDVDDVTLPGIQGEFGVLPGHTTLLTGLGEGPLHYRKGNDVTTYQISGGFCEVSQDHILVLADRVS